jgi:dCMP deaminase
MNDKWEKWDQRFMDLAAHVSTWSKDPSTKVGSVIVRLDRTVVSLGYNGFPRSVDDDLKRYMDRSAKYLFVVHAEINALLSSHEGLMGYTLYSYPMMPCAQCAAAIIQAGIGRVVYHIPADKKLSERWAAEQRVSTQMFLEAGVALDFL